MLVERRGNLRLILLLAIVVLVTAPYWTRRSDSSVLARQTLFPVSDTQDDYRDVGPIAEQKKQTLAGPAEERFVYDSVDHSTNYVPEGDFRILYSQSTKDRKYFSVDFSGANAYNPNIIPHPTDTTKWIVVAQDSAYRDDIGSSEQVVCVAEFKNGVLHCPKWPTALPISPSIDGKCDDEWSYTNMRRGPRDARVFYGPQYPYIIYGSQSSRTCLGLWIQNLWMLLDHAKHPPESFARGLTEILRPKPWRQIEKNYFLFWDENNNVFAHYDMWPKRAFAKLRHDGSVVSAFMESEGLDLAPQSAENDEQCLKKFPAMDENKEQGIHQGTNSLMITMCKRADPTCKPDDDNTFIMHMIQHKTFEYAHGVYVPYPVLFRRRAPFELHAVGEKPLFFHGIELLTEKTGSRHVKTFNLEVPNGHNEMAYTTSISWKDHNQTYHGYLDDVLFIGFGIEDTRSAAIDVLASDVLQDLSFCSS